jgi:hypothetical protein
VSRTKGGIESTIAWEFQPELGQTKLNIRADYVVPIPLVGRLAEAIVARINEQEIEVMLAYLKAKVEWVVRSK